MSKLNRRLLLGGILSAGVGVLSLSETGNALSGGSGWTILAYNLHTKELHNYSASVKTRCCISGKKIFCK